MKTQGHVFKYPDNVDTDVIIPARYLNTADAKELPLLVFAFRKFSNVSVHILTHFFLCVK